MEIHAGDKVRLECEVKPGPFSGERLVSFESLDGPISGFVNEGELLFINEKPYLKATAQEVHQDYVLVKVRGSFFTTNGIASVSRNLAMAA